MSRQAGQLAGELASQYPDTYIQTHVAENTDEVKWVKELFPDSRSYLDVYEKRGLMRKRALYAHCIWLDDDDRARMAATESVATVCPTSNLFLGSGLFNKAGLEQAKREMDMLAQIGGMRMAAPPAGAPGRG